jgi:hypothetical protein
VAIRFRNSIEAKSTIPAAMHDNFGDLAHPHLGNRTMFGLGITSLSIEFVAKPEEAHRIQSVVPSAITGSLNAVTGFVGCLVMVSDQEARLVTVVTFWEGEHRRQLNSKNSRWVLAILAPYLDRCLRVQTMIAHLPKLFNAGQTQDSEPDFSSVPSLAAEEEAVCVV